MQALSNVASSRVLRFKVDRVLVDRIYIDRQYVDRPNVDKVIPQIIRQHTKYVDLNFLMLQYSLRAGNYAQGIYGLVQLLSPS